MRGTENHRLLPVCSCRITPACAGNSPLAVARSAFAKDHPRVCGEQGGYFMIQVDGIGSPPRVRGTEKFWAHMPRWMRITPACAGNRLSFLCLAIPSRDHPRVCGEQSGFSISPSFVQGSPPRVRGTASFDVSGRKISRITPACAGNSNILYI